MVCRGEESELKSDRGLATRTLSKAFKTGQTYKGRRGDCITLATRYWLAGQGGDWREASDKWSDRAEIHDKLHSGALQACRRSANLLLCFGARARNHEGATMAVRPDGEAKVPHRR